MVTGLPKSKSFDYRIIGVGLSSLQVIYFDEFIRAFETKAFNAHVNFTFKVILNFCVQWPLAQKVRCE